MDKKLRICYAENEDRKSIYELRHDIYAKELGQHKATALGYLQDELDAHNTYILIKRGSAVLGFISITSPGSAKFSVDKYFDRSLTPYAFDEELFEVRLLSVVKESRNSWLALALMHAAKRFVEAHGGKHLVAICREDLLDMYEKAGLIPSPNIAKSGEVSYILCSATIEQLSRAALRYASQLETIEQMVNWELHFSFANDAPCFHGGSFFKAIGEELDNTHKRHDIINADVLDAWFMPSPKVVDAITRDLQWLLQTSPPTHNKGLIDVISRTRGIGPENILPGAGSSDLIFLGLQNLVTCNSRVLLLDPCYGEYKHVLDNLLKCEVTPFKLYFTEGFNIDADRLRSELTKGYDLVVLVNPNSPTGVYLDTTILKNILKLAPTGTIVWIDETYIEYAGAENSLEQFAAASENVIVCKSMSKVYALSGARVAYLCAGRHIIKYLSAFAPPWSVSLPAQMAAIKALEDGSYYDKKYQETHILRQKLMAELKALGFDPIIPGIANFILCYLPNGSNKVVEFIERCKDRGLFLRDVTNMGSTIGNGAVRIAVKDSNTNIRMLRIMEEALTGL